MRILWVSYYRDDYGMAYLKRLFNTLEDGTSFYITLRWWFKKGQLELNTDNLIKECKKNKYNVVVLHYPQFVGVINIKDAIKGFKVAGANVALILDGCWNKASYGEDLRIPYPMIPEKLIKLFKSLGPH